MKNVKFEWLFYIQRYSAPQVLLSEIAEKGTLCLLLDQVAMGTDLFRVNLIPEMGHPRKAEEVLLAVVRTSDVFYRYLLEDEMQTLSSSETMVISSYYERVLVILQSLLDWLEELPIFNDVKTLAVLPVTQYRLSRINAEFLIKLRKLSIYLFRSSIDPTLSKLVLDEFSNLKGNKLFSILNFSYVSSFSKSFNELLPATTMEFVTFLYQNNFNSHAFMSYCVTHCRDIVADEPDLYRQVEVLCQIEDQTIQLLNPARQTWSATNVAIEVQIRKFIDEKKQYLSDRIKMRNALSNISFEGECVEKLRLNIPVSMFAVFIRLLIIARVISDEQIGKTFQFFARHFSTENAPVISSESLHRKSTDIQTSTAIKVKSLLLSKINWLKAQYSV